MANYQNHVIDPTFFYDAIEEFSFDYDIFICIGKKTDNLGKRHLQYDKQTIRGSLQSQGSKIIRSKEGATVEKNYNFYCKSLYRIKRNDVIFYKNDYYICNGVHDYDEYGVRWAELSLIKLTQYNDLADYVKYLKGVKLV